MGKDALWAKAALGRANPRAHLVPGHPRADPPHPGRDLEWSGVTEGKKEVEINSEMRSRC